MSERPIRVLVAKVGLDGHDRGAKIVARCLRDAGADDILLVAGGVIPDEDVPALRDLGVAEVILQDTPPETIVTRIRDLVAARPTP